MPRIVFYKNSMEYGPNLKTRLIQKLNSKTMGNYQGIMALRSWNTLAKLKTICQMEKEKNSLLMNKGVYHKIITATGSRVKSMVFSKLRSIVDNNITIKTIWQKQNLKMKNQLGFTLTISKNLGFVNLKELNLDWWKDNM